MTVRPPKPQIQRKKRPELWDALTITLAIAVVLLGLAIFLLPKPDSKSQHERAKPASPEMALKARAKSFSA